jgi:predicted amino acid racemase
MELMTSEAGSYIPLPFFRRVIRRAESVGDHAMLCVGEKGRWWVGERVALEKVQRAKRMYTIEY